MHSSWKLGLCTCLAVFTTTGAFAAQTKAEPALVPNRILHNVDETRMVRLAGNTHPMVNRATDLGVVGDALTLDRVVLVLKRSPEQEAALARFMAEQYDPESANFHHWLKPEEFGAAYGPSEADIQQVTSWLQNHGLQINYVSKGRVTIEFSGTARQVQEAFHTEIHRFVSSGVEHVANSVDPQIPEALSPVVEGISSLHDFFPVSQMVRGAFVTRDAKTGKITPIRTDKKVNPAGKGAMPQFTYVDQNDYIREDVAPYDFAAIYNLTPLWNAGIDGTGQTIAISGASDISLKDVATFQKSFGLPNNVPTITHNGADPGYVSGARGENTLDVEWSGATAPHAKVVLVVSGSTKTTFGGQLSDEYIIDHVTAPVMSASYGACELNLGTAANAAYNKLYQQGAAEGISIFESAGDQGSAGCESQDTPAPNAASTGLQVNGLASSPFVTAVGGTDLYWENQTYTKYWNTSNSSKGATAKGYMPEIPWNSTCTSIYLEQGFKEPSLEQTCNDALNSSNYQGLVVIASGSGGKSACTTPSGNKPADCAGGYAKPAWQSMTGVPADGKRDLPDVSLFASGGYPDGIVGSAYLFCDSESVACNYSDNGEIIYQETGGTSAASPALAGIMSLVVQKMGNKPQGLANPVFYALAASESLSSCNSNSATNGNKCVFYDTTTGNNSQVCVTGSPNCSTKTSGDEVGVLTGYTTTTGYDLATGLGSVNAQNLVNGWSAALSGQAITLSPTSLTFSTTKKGTSSASQTVTVSDKGSHAHSVYISGIEFLGSGASSYSATTTCPISPNKFSSGTTCSIKVTFKPTTTGTLTATMKLLDNATGAPQNVALTGKGD